MTTLAIRSVFGVPQRHSRTVRAVVRWTVVLTACYTLAECAETLALPAPQLPVSLLVGTVLALTGLVREQPPRPLTRSSHAVVGALMGTYLDLPTLRSIAPTAAPLALVTLASVGICTAVAFGLTHLTRIPLPDSLLGLTPGGSAAIVASADDVGADPRLVAFAQYIRVGLVAFTAPFIALTVQPAPTTPDTSGEPVDIALPATGHLIAASGQLTGLLVLTAICVLGGHLGRRLALPAPVLLGTMLVAATAVATDAVSGFTPAGPLRDLVFVVVGLEVGLRFTRPVLRHVGRLIPHLAAATILVCAACAGLAWLLATLLGTSFLEAYLATTPGGINAVLATAASTRVDVPVVSTVQSLRLFAVCLLVPFLIRKLGAAAGGAR